MDIFLCQQVEKYMTIFKECVMLHFIVLLIIKSFVQP